MRLGILVPTERVERLHLPPYAQRPRPLLRSLRMKRFGRPALPFENLPSVFLPLLMCYYITHIDRTWQLIKVGASLTFSSLGA